MKTVSKKLLSLLLVAVLLVSALPFQAFADAHDENDPNHISGVWTYDATGHWHVCPKADCDQAGQQLNFNTHTFQNGVCETCGYQCPHTNQVQDPSTAVAADCVHDGKEADTVCADCKAVIATGATIPATGVHNYVNGICTDCGAVQTGTSFNLTLNADGGTLNGFPSATVTVTQGAPISVLPDPTRQGYTFAGWYIDGVRVNLGDVYNYGADKTAIAHWTEQTYQLTVRYVLNGNNATANTITTVNVPAGTPLLGYLNANVTGLVRDELAKHPGYSWQSNFWKDYSGTQPLTGQDAVMNQAQTVFVNFVSNAYTLYFSPNGGAVTPTSKTVYFGSPIGTVPTPVLNGKVFQGWKDANGNIYTNSQLAAKSYDYAGDTTLTAVWKDEALVILYIYVNGNFASSDRMIVMDRFVQGSNISRSDVVGEVAKYYRAAYGNLSIAGLFDEYTWSSYRANTSKAGTENIQIDGSHPNKIYVMVNNAVTGTTVLPTNPTTPTVTIPTSGGYWVVTGPNTGYWVTGTQPSGSTWISTGNGNGYWSYNPGNITNPTTPSYIYVPGTNPKTGDTAKIEIAAAVMVLAAAALVTMMALRKKKI